MEARSETPPMEDIRSDTPPMESWNDRLPHQATESKLTQSSCFMYTASEASNAPLMMFQPAPVLINGDQAVGLPLSYPYAHASAALPHALDYNSCVERGGHPITHVPVAHADDGAGRLTSTTVHPAATIASFELSGTLPLGVQPTSVPTFQPAPRLPMLQPTSMPIPSMPTMWAHMQGSHGSTNMVSAPPSASDYTFDAVKGNRRKRSEMLAKSEIATPLMPSTTTDLLRQLVGPEQFSLTLQCKASRAKPSKPSSSKPEERPDDAVDDDATNLNALANEYVDRCVASLPPSASVPWAKVWAGLKAAKLCKPTITKAAVRHRLCRRQVVRVSPESKG